MAEQLERDPTVTLTELLENQKYTSLSTLITRLQKEDAEVRKSIDVLTQIKEEINAEDTILDQPESLSYEKLRSTIEANKANLGGTLKYLAK